MRIDWSVRLSIVPGWRAWMDGGLVKADSERTFVLGATYVHIVRDCEGSCARRDYEKLAGIICLL